MGEKQLIKMAKEKAAGLFLVNREDKILVGHPTRHNPNFWSIPKGKLDGDETPLQAAIRETYEESNVKLFHDLHEFIFIGKELYRHKKKDITLFAHFETENENWDKLNITCNSNVPEEKGGFPEMDAFRWVTLDEARTILHETQVRMLDKLDEEIVEFRYRERLFKMWCYECNKITPHTPKLSAEMSGCKVCYECSRMNPVCTLNKLTNLDEGLSTWTSTSVGFFEWDDDGSFKEKYDEPTLGLSCMLSPFNTSFKYSTTKIVEIIENDTSSTRRYLKFKTVNNTYELYYHKQ
jgi:8-oxo-dGTP pyrophosphatase MutT (NUDIX family)